MSVSWVYTIPGWLTPHEGAFLLKAAGCQNSLPGEVVEIGSYEGKSTIFLAQGSVHVTAIDPHKGNVSGGVLAPTYGNFRKNISRAGVSKKITALVTTSKTAAKMWKKPIKLLFIDGLHDEPHASEDYLVWSKFVTKGGIVAMHDAFCGWAGARNVAMRHIVRSDAYSEIGVVGSIVYGVKGTATGLKRVTKIFRKYTIELCQRIYYTDRIPKWIRYVLVHKIFRILLFNRFSSFR